MKKCNRRRFLMAGLAAGAVGLETATAGSALLPLIRSFRPSADDRPSLKGLKIGVTDWNLRRAARIEAVELAARLGFDGVEVSLGRDVQENKLPLDDAELRARYRAEFQRHGIEIAGTCLDVLHRNYLKNDPLGQKWVVDGVRLTKDLNARVMLLPFFGDGALRTQAERDYVGDVLRELAPEAERAGVILGLENTNSARENVGIMERSRSPAVLVYYDVGNSTNNGYDILEEIPWLGPERICQFHLKDNPHYLGEGSIDFPAVMRAIAEIRFEGFGNLETASPSNSLEEDMKRNLAFIRQVVREVEA